MPYECVHQQRNLVEYRFHPTRLSQYIDWLDHSALQSQPVLAWRRVLPWQLELESQPVLELQPAWGRRQPTSCWQLPGRLEKLTIYASFFSSQILKGFNLSLTRAKTNCHYSSEQPPPFESR